MQYTTHDKPYHTAYIPYICHRPDLIDLESRCVCCQDTRRISVTLEAYSKWTHGVLVQVAFPTVSAADREQFFQTGICGSCFTEMFANPMSR